MDNTEKTMKDKKRRNILVVFAISFGVLIIAAITTGVLLNSRFKEILLKEINKQLIVKVDVEKVSFSFFRSFPYATLTFENIYVPSHLNTAKPLLDAENLFLKFSLADIIKKNYNIRRIDIKNGTLSIVIPETGDPNYYIFKKSDDKHEGMDLALRRVEIKNVSVKYIDKDQGIDADIVSTRTNLRGSFTAQEYKLRLGGDIHLYRVKIGEDPFFSGQHADISLIIDVDKVLKRHTIKRCNLNIEGLPLLAFGVITTKEKENSVDLTFEGNRMNIGHLLSLLPESYQHLRDEYKPSGSVSLTGKIFGKISGNISPKVVFTANVSDAKIRHRDSGLELKDLRFDGELKKSMRESTLNIMDLSAKLGDGEIKGDISFVDFKEPTLQMNIETDLAVADYIDFFKVKGFSEGDGRIRLYLNAETKIAFNEQLTVTQLLGSTVNGELLLGEISFSIEDDQRTFSNLNGRLVFNNNDVRATDLRININNSAMFFSGYFRNLIPFFLLENQALEFNGRLQSAKIDLKDILYSSTLKEKEVKEAKREAVNLPSNISGLIDLNIEKVEYDNFNSEDIRGQLRITRNGIYAERVSMKAFNGTVNGAAFLSQQGNNNFSFDCEMNTYNSDIRLLFYQFSNFGQSDITSDNLRGKLTGRIRFHSLLNNSLEFILPTLETNGELVIEEGALIDFEPVEELAKYTRLDDLSNIRFQTLRNEIRIANQSIYIPEMMIRSDAVNLLLAGIHSFNGDIQYNISLRLSELLTRKAKRSQDKSLYLPASEEDSRGRMTLYLIIEGSIHDPVVRYDRKRRTERFRQELRNERAEIREIFKQEFGTFIRSEKRTKVKERDKKNGEIIIEWDDY